MTTTSFFDPESDRDEDGAVGATPDRGGGGFFSDLPGWSLPFLGALGMVVAIVLATGAVRLATQGVPALGRGIGSAAYRTSSFWGSLTRRQPTAPAVEPGAPRATTGARIGGFLLALTSPFRRIGSLFTRKDNSARPLRIHRKATAAGIWDRFVLRLRMTRARMTRTRASVKGNKRYWWLRFRRYLPWRR